MAMGGIARARSRFSFGGILGGRNRRVSPTETLGDPGTAVFGGFVETDEKSDRLIGTRRYITYSDMIANTTIIAAGIRYYMNLVSKAEWTIQPSEPNNAAAEDAAEFLTDVMDDMRRPWHRVIRRASGYRLYGFSVQEMTAKRRDDGRIGMLDIFPRPQVTIEKWDLADDSEIVGIVQRSKQDGREIYIPRTKAIYLVDDALNDSPEGLGLLRHLVDTNDRLKRYQDLEGFGFETELRGVPIGRAPLAELQKAVRDGTMTLKEANDLLAPMTKFLKQHIKNPRLALLLDSMPWFGQGEGSLNASSNRQFELELVRGNTNGAEPVNVAIDRLQREIARVLGVEFLLLGNSGSQALSRDKSHNFGLLVESALDEIRESFENDFLPFIMNLNGIPRDIWPTIKTETVQYRDPNEITEGLERLSRAALRPDDPAQNEVRELLGVSPLPEDLINMLLDEASREMDALEEDPDDPENDDDPPADDDE